MEEFSFKNEPTFKIGSTYSVCLRGARRLDKIKVYPLKFNNEFIGRAQIESQKQFRFCDISAFDCLDNYDPEATTNDGLKNAMCKVYEDFDTAEIVTLVQFKVISLF